MPQIINQGANSGQQASGTPTTSAVLIHHDIIARSLVLSGGRWPSAKRAMGPANTWGQSRRTVSIADDGPRQDTSAPARDSKVRIVRNMPAERHRAPSSG